MQEADVLGDFYSPNTEFEGLNSQKANMSKTDVTNYTSSSQHLNQESSQSINKRDEEVGERLDLKTIANEESYQEAITHRTESEAPLTNRTVIKQVYIHFHSSIFPNLFSKTSLNHFFLLNT